MDSKFGPQHYMLNGTTEVLPASQFLQERLQERRARNARPKRARQSDFPPRTGRDDDIFLTEAEESRNGTRLFDSSPLTAASTRTSEAGGSTNRRRTLGVKDMDGAMDRLNKDNFALKLELDHRREQTLQLQDQLDAMREQVERARLLEDEHAELLEINVQMVKELETRDEAVKEALEIILEMEEKMVDLEDRSSHTRPSTSGNADSGYAGTETHEPMLHSSPADFSKMPKTPRINTRQPPVAASAAPGKLYQAVNGATPAKIKREPSVLSQKRPSTHALRSVYLENAQGLHPVKSFQSLLSRRDKAEDDSPEELSSPRLSVLSESSFPSLYSPKKTSPEKYAWEVADDDEQHSVHSHLRQDSIKRVSQWMSEGGDLDDTPSKPNRVSSPLAQHDDAAASTGVRPTDPAQFQSLNNALSTPPIPTTRPTYELLQPLAYRADKQAAKQRNPVTIGGPIFGEPLLPPTPDSASTRMLRPSRSSINDERSLLDITPATVKGYNALEPGMRTAPKQMRSSIELNSAHFNNLQYRESGLRYERDSDSDEEDQNADDAAHDPSPEYDGFPDGNSILMGTPSRFLKHSKPPAAQMFFDGNDASPPKSARSPPRRRQSSSEATVSPRKPSMTRAETSPTFFGSLSRIVTNGSKSTVDAMGVTSPTRSTNSGSSGNRTVVQNEPFDGRNGSLSPELSRATRAQAPPSRTLTQKTQQLFRRMSNSHSEPRSPREKSPLPTLTTTPSTAYVNTMPKEARRPSTSEASKQLPGHLAQRAPACGERRRPSLQARKTEPAAPRPASVASTERSAAVMTPNERRNPFKRNNSIKKAAELPLPSDASQDDGAQRGGFPRRTGSIREAVASGKRPWR